LSGWLAELEREAGTITAQRGAAQTAHASILAAQPAPASSGGTRTVLAVLVALAHAGGRRSDGCCAAGVRTAMKDGIRPGARVRVRIPRNSPCSLHCLDSVPLLEATGRVDGIEAGLRPCRGGPSLVCRAAGG